MEKIRQIEKMVKKKEDIEDGEVKSGSDDDPALKMLNQLKSQIVSEHMYLLFVSFWIVVLAVCGVCKLR